MLKFWPPVLNEGICVHIYGLARSFRPKGLTGLAAPPSSCSPVQASQLPRVLGSRLAAVPSRPAQPPRAAMPPSKGKKKNPSASPRPSPRTPPSRSSAAGSGTGDGERSLDLPSIAAAAAAQFPSLVPRGGDGCFAGTVAEVGPRDGSRGGRLGRLWLSEAAMVGAGMRPGCLVSVSSCFAPLLVPRRCSFDLGLYISANC